MSDIVIKELHDYTAEELGDLFLSVKWSSGCYPEKLQKAMKGYETVFSAWDGDKLIGMICAMDDGAMTAYVHYVLVRPEYHGRGIGKQLLEKVKERYKDYLRIAIISYTKEVPFYEHCGFKKSDDTTAVFITDLWT